MRGVPTVVCLCAAFLWLDQPTTSSGATPTSNLLGGPYSVALNWDPSPDTNVVGYFLDWGVADGLCTNRQDAGNTNLLTFGGLQSHVTYYFQVSAYDSGGQESLASNEVQYSVPDQAPAVTGSDFALCVTPGLQAGGTLTLTWSAVIGQSYRVQYCSNLTLASWSDLTSSITRSPIPRGLLPNAFIEW